MKKHHIKQHKGAAPQPASEEDYFHDPDADQLDKLQLQNFQDRTYSKMLNQQSKSKKKHNSYFQNHPKYQTKSKNLQEQSEQQIQQQSEPIQEQDNPDEAIRQALITLKAEKNINLKTLGQQLNKLQEQDQHFFKDLHIQNTQNKHQSENLKNQLDLFNQLVGVRYHEQNFLQQIKKFPYQNYPTNEALAEKRNLLESGIIRNLNKLVTIMSNYQQKCAQSQPIDEEQNVEPQEQIQNDIIFKQVQELLQQVTNNQQLGVKSINTTGLFNKFEDDVKKFKKQIENQMIKWSQKTNLLSTNNKNAHYSSLIMQTPIGQVQKIMSNWPRSSIKCQQKRSAFKILFQPPDDIHQYSSPQIFDDFQLFQQLEKHYEKHLQNIEAQDNQFLINNTMKYLKQREKTKNIKKQVDRKASKNRKLRYQVHAKLLNFMPCQPAKTLLQTRDEIVRNIFNSQAIQQSKNKSNEQIDYIDM